MKKYFKIIGILELASWLSGVVTLIVFIGPLINGAQNKGAAAFTLIMGLIFVIIAGPALGLLFIHYSNSIEEKPNNKDLNK